MNGKQKHQNAASDAEQCGGNDRWILPSVACVLIREELLSRTRSVGFSGRTRIGIHEIKCSVKVTNLSSVCHSDLFPTPVQSVGPSRMKRCLGAFWENDHHSHRSYWSHFFSSLSGHNFVWFDNSRCPRLIHVISVTLRNITQSEDSWQFINKLFHIFLLKDPHPSRLVASGCLTARISALIFCPDVRDLYILKFTATYAPLSVWA